MKVGILFKMLKFITVMKMLANLLYSSTPHAQAEGFATMILLIIFSIIAVTVLSYLIHRFSKNAKNKHLARASLFHNYTACVTRKAHIAPVVCISHKT